MTYRKKVIKKMSRRVVAVLAGMALLLNCFPVTAADQAVGKVQEEAGNEAGMDTDDACGEEIKACETELETEAGLESRLPDETEPENEQQSEAESEPAREPSSEAETEPESELQSEVETEPESESQSEVETEPESEQQSEAETEMESEQQSEAETEWESELLSGAETESESEPQSETETELESEKQSEAETELESEPQSEVETESESEPQSEAETEPESEQQSEAETEWESELLIGAETELESEPQSEVETETESELLSGTETESESELQSENETKQPSKPKKKPVLSDKDKTLVDVQRTQTLIQSQQASQPAIYWDESWYVEPDYRFTQVEKRYVLAGGGQGVCVYEAPDYSSETVGELPYFGLAYILEKTDEDWNYIESGEVRGFVPAEQLTEELYAKELVSMIGETSFCLAAAYCEKADNEAFTYTHTTVQNVIAEKKYALPIQSAAIYEYPETVSRVVGEAGSGYLVYILEEEIQAEAEQDAGQEWVYVESGDARGFMQSCVLLSGRTASDVVSQVGEEQMCQATVLVEPEENRSCYYTLASVVAASVPRIGEQIAEYASRFAGILPYVWGGTSLSSGADCSGFVQSVYAMFGISLPRVADSQGASGMEVSGLYDAQPGDVIYWASGPHVGIYLGNGEVVHCTGSRSNTAQNPGRGVMISRADYQPITSIRRYIITYDSGNARADQTPYTQDQLELIWAIVAQEDNGSYDGALAVISSAMNRTESPTWSYLGGNALSQLMAPGQYCYSIDSYWIPRLNGNVPEYVKQAVNDCLKRGIRNHSFTSFRSRKGSQTGPHAVQIGGNWFFGN